MIRPRSIALCLVPLLLGACSAAASISPSPSMGGNIGHPSGARDLVLRYETTGGFVPREALLGRYPTVSVYGDGTVITEGPQIAIYPGPALPNLIATKLTETGLQRLLAFAAQAGLLGPDAQFDAIGIADAGTAQFTVVAEGTRHTISAYALNESQDRGLAPAVAAQRARLRALVSRLNDLRGALGAGEVGAEAPYRFTAVRLFVQPAVPPTDGLIQPVIAWPLAIPLTTFGESAQPGDGAALRCGVVSGADLEVLRPLLMRANQGSPWRSGGHNFSLTIRVLLPDESGCPGVE
jgi:hypothetical protein